MAFGRRGRRALVGSAAKLTAKNSAYAKRMQEPWQNRALAYYDQIGELRFCSQFYARMLSRVDFFPATKSDDGDKLKRITEGPAVDLLSRIQDPGGGRKRIQYNYGRLMFVTGEGVLLGTDLDSEEDEKWRFLWREEVFVNDDGVAERKLSDGTFSGEKGTAYRMWTSHPQWSDRADSPLRAVLDIAEELLILTASVRATATTRLLNGILALPTEAAPASFEEGVDDDPEMNPFLVKLVEHITSQIENPGSAEARVPFLIEAGYEYIDRIKWIQLHDSATDYMEKDLRMEAIDRLALALDLPPEALKGLADANHWTGQQVQWDMWRSHGIPIADQFAVDLNETYLRPALREEGEDPTDIVIGYDDSQVVVSPDQTAVADAAMDRAAISFAGYRQLKGIPEDMAPNDEEKAFVFGLKTRDPVVAGLEEEAPSVRGPQAAPGAQELPSQVPPQPTNGRVVSRQEARTASINGAAMLALRQCRAKAGARLRTSLGDPNQEPRKKKCAECEEAIVDVPNAMVASVLGAETLERMAKRDPLAMVKGGTDDFRGCLEEWGISAANTAVLCERIESYAAATLFEPNTPDLPPGFTSHVDHALEMSDRVAIAT